jgi:CoA:oxalate CoA-transferase
MPDRDADDLPLAGVRVVDLTHHVAGPYCTHLLATHGASVVKIERPGGDPARRLPPFLERGDGGRESLLFRYLNRGKETLTLDLKDPAGRDRCLALAREADVVVENFRPGTLNRLGLGWETLHALNPRLILTSISNFGQDGPYRDFKAWDIVADALGGLAYIFGYADREPLTHPNPQAQYRAGVYAASATVAALLNLDGEGEHVDVSIVECIAAALRDTVPQYTYMGAVRKRSSRPEGGPGVPTSCSDGYVILSAFGVSSFDEIARLLRAPELADERFATGEGRERHAAELRVLMQEALARWSKWQFFHESQAWGFGAGIVLTPQEVAESEQLAARGFFHSLEIESGRSLPAPNRPVEL